MKTFARYKRIAALLMALVMLMTAAGCSGSKPGAPDESDISVTNDDPLRGSMIVNGDFSNPKEMHWAMYTESGGNATCGIRDEALVITVNKAGKCSWAVQAYYDGVTLNRGAEYMFRFDISTSVEKNIDAIIQYNGGDYHPYIKKTVKCKPETKTVEIPFTMKMTTDPAPRVCFNCGRPAADEEGVSAVQEADKEFPPFEIIIDNVGVICTKPSDEEEEEAELSKINLNQIGYLPSAAKKAIVRGAVESKDFYIEDVSGNKVYSGKLSDGFQNKTASETDAYADFSELTAPGKYKVVLADGYKSYEFVIGDGIYSDAFESIVKMLYLQRCGCELPSDKAGSFAHPACHTDEAIIYGTDTKIDVSGGWHDAGDYGRYVVSGAKAAMDLMLSYEENPSLFGDSAGIPESGNGTPDILDEVRYELEWMLKMQDESGGVYHKVTGLNFPSVVMPEDEDWELYVCPISSTATGDFAAVMAHASRVFSFDREFASACLDAAKKAWNYLDENPFDGTGFTNPADVVTGEYPDGQDIDERFWAASELLAVTGDRAYSDYIYDAVKQVKDSLADSNPDNDIIIDNLGWANVGVYGMLAYLSAEPGRVNADTRGAVLGMLTGYADNIVANSKSDGYFISMGYYYPWGSNMNIMNNAMILLFADKFAPKDDYRYYAAQHMNYIFGANALGTCFVTGCGTVSPHNPHHRPSQSVGQAMPGMMVGGVDSSLEDPYAQAVLRESPLAMRYVDNEQSYSTNEVCVYWNSPLIYVMTSCCFE